MADTQQILEGSCLLTTGEAIDEKGLMIAINTGTGVAMKASDAASRRVVGMNKEVALIGDTEFVANRGIYVFDNDGTNPLAKDDIGNNCYVKDEKTVDKTGGANLVVAGKVIDVTTEGVAVEI